MTAPANMLRANRTKERTVLLWIRAVVAVVLLFAAVLNFASEAGGNVSIGLALILAVAFTACVMLTAVIGWRTDEREQRISLECCAAAFAGTALGFIVLLTVIWRQDALQLPFNAPVTLGALGYCGARVARAVVEHRRK